MRAWHSQYFSPPGCSKNGFSPSPLPYVRPDAAGLASWIKLETCLLPHLASFDRELEHLTQISLLSVSINPPLVAVPVTSSSLIATSLHFVPSLPSVPFFPQLNERSYQTQSASTRGTHYLNTHTSRPELSKSPTSYRFGYTKSIFTKTLALPNFLLPTRPPRHKPQSEFSGLCSFPATNLFIARL